VKAVLQPVTFSTGVSLPTQANWQSAVAALRVCLVSVRSIGWGALDRRG
jgi:hypothetical protein